MNSNLRLAMAVVAGGVIGAVVSQTINAQAPKTGPGIIITEHEVRDSQGYAPYAAGVPATLEALGGRLLVNGGEVTTLEGDRPKGRMTVITFDTVEKAQAWYQSPAYQAIKSVRLKAANSRVYLVEGVAN